MDYQKKVIFYLDLWQLYADVTSNLPAINPNKSTLIKATSGRCPWVWV